MSAIASGEPVIFRNFGRKKSVVTYHMPDFLFTYVVAGSGTVCVGNECCSVMAGNSFVVARRQETVVTLFPDEESACFDTLNIRISSEEVADYFLHHPVPDKSAKTADVLLQLQSDHPLLHGLCLLLADGMRQGFRPEWSFTKMKIQECIHILVVLNKRMYDWFSFRNHPQKINLRGFMEQNFRHNVPLEQLAGAVGRSLSTFRRDFVNEFGVTPSRWLIARRLDEAQELLLAGKRPGEILIELGFESFSHFTRCFKQRFGVLPSEKTNNR